MPVQHNEELADDPNADSSYKPRREGYDSRIQQILFEDPDLEIIITDAGKAPDGSYIVYRIRTGVGILSSTVRSRIDTHQGDRSHTALFRIRVPPRRVGQSTSDADNSAHP